MKLLLKILPIKAPSGRREPIQDSSMSVGIFPIGFSSKFKFLNFGTDGDVQPNVAPTDMVEMLAA